MSGFFWPFDVSSVALYVDGNDVYVVVDWSYFAKAAKEGTKVSTRISPQTASLVAGGHRRTSDLDARMGQMLGKLRADPGTYEGWIAELEEGGGDPRAGAFVVGLRLLLDPNRQGSLRDLDRRAELVRVALLKNGQ